MAAGQVTLVAAEAGRVDHRRLHRRDVAAVDVVGLHALGQRRPGPGGGVDDDLVDPLPQLGRQLIEGAVVEPHVAGRADDHAARVGPRHHLRGDGPARVEREDRRRRGEDLRRGRRGQRHVRVRLPDGLTGGRVGDAAVQGRHRRVLRGRLQRGCGGGGIDLDQAGGVVGGQHQLLRLLQLVGGRVPQAGVALVDFHAEHRRARHRGSQQDHGDSGDNVLCTHPVQTTGRATGYDGGRYCLIT